MYKDITIIGAGPAGVAAAIQLKREGFEPFLLEQDKVGGLLWNANLFVDKGYEVILSPGEPEENKIGSNCGQYVTSYETPELEKGLYETEKYTIFNSTKG